MHSLTGSFQILHQCFPRLKALIGPFDSPFCWAVFLPRGELSAMRNFMHQKNEEPRDVRIKVT
jgi:hypothetical protein